MLPARFSITVAVDADGLAEAQAVAGAGNLVLDGALISGGKWVAATDGGQQVTVASAGDDSGITFTVAGRDQDGKALSVTVTGANAGDATTTSYFSRVDSISASAAAAGNVSAGFLGTAALPTYVVNYKMTPFQAALHVDVTGTLNGTVQHTFGDVWAHGQYATDWVWNSNSDTDLVGFTAAQDGNYAFAPMATRCIVNSASDGAILTYTVMVPA